LFQRLTNLQSSALAEEGRIMFNQVTGYNTIEVLKEDLITQKEKFQELKKRVKSLRYDVPKKEKEHLKASESVVSLLQRSSLTMDRDLQLQRDIFDAMGRRDALRKEDGELKEQLRLLEEELDQAFNKITESMLERFNQEQNWSDKIRRSSTIITTGMMGLNVFVFAASHGIFIPLSQSRLKKNLTEIVVKEGQSTRTDLIAIVHEDQELRKKQERETGEAKAQAENEKKVGVLSNILETAVRPPQVAEVHHTTTTTVATAAYVEPAIFGDALTDKKVMLGACALAAVFSATVLLVRLWSPSN